MRLVFIEESRMDYSDVTNLIKCCTTILPDVYKNAHTLVEQSRKSDIYIPRLSVVVKHHNQVIGHTSVVKTTVKGPNAEYNCPMLISHYVYPEYQQQGVGSALLESLHARAEGLGYACMALVGRRHYYGKFGYIDLATAKITMPPNAYRGHALIKQLVPGCLLTMKGIMQLPDLLTDGLDGFESNHFAGISA